MFDITEFIDVDAKGRAHCPCCTAEGKKRKNLSVVLDGESKGAYKCFRGHTPEEIRAAIGAPKVQQLPAALIENKPNLLTRRAVDQATNRLYKNAQAVAWLKRRGITAQMVKRHRLGLYDCVIGKRRNVPAIGIPIPADESKEAFYIKKRVAPWDTEIQALDDYVPWKQWGIPAQILFTHKPKNATETWLCEGEWDAIMLADTLRNLSHEEAIAVACFTCGASNVPAGEQLLRLVGDTIVWYDIDKAGQNGAKKVQQAIGKGCRIATVPAPDAPILGWDISDALNAGHLWSEFESARQNAKDWEPEPEPQSLNPVRERLIWNDTLLDTAPDYTDWLVPDLLTQNELFLLAAGARTGKSLMSMTLAKAVATGGEFLGRPATQGTVLYVAIEDGAAKLKEREQAQGWERGMPVVWLPKFKLSELPHLREVASEIEDLRLVVIDTLSRVKDSNVSESSAEMSQILEPLQDMASELDVCVVLVHHTGKVNIDNAQAVDIFDTIRGSSAIRAVCRGSMVIAAGERDYRLVVENGWGKHDLKVVLDANTLTWRLLGKWNPVANLTQKDQILEFLRKVQSANIEQISEATGIDKKSLYTQLSRLQIAENAEEKVIKEGKRRNYTYRLSLFNSIQQLNSLLNSEKPDGENDTGDIQQNIICDTPPTENSNEIENEIKSETDKDCRIVEYSAETQAQQDVQLFNSYSTVEYSVGDVVEIRTTGQFYGKHAKIERIDGKTALLRADSWYVTQSHLLQNLKLVKSREPK